MELALALTALKVLRLGYDGWEAFCSEGIDGKELGVLQSALTTAGEVAGRAEARPAAQYIALVLAAFGRAFERHWVGARSLDRPGRLKRWFDRDERARDDDFRARLACARLDAAAVGDRGADELDRVDGLCGHPLNAPAYRELWRVFTDPALLDDGAEPPLDLDGRSKHAFERHYLLAWQQAFESPAGAPVRQWMASLGDYRAMLVRDCIIADLATWDQRHVFGNHPREGWSDTGGMPFLPLGEMYIEPAARPIDDDGEGGEASPVQALIDPREVGGAPYVTVIKADFGRGKSLSARTLAYRLAQAWQHDAETPSIDVWRPIVVRCADDVHSETPQLGSMVRSALKRQAEAIGISRDDDDDAFALPAPEQRTLIIIDGLDEVVFGRTALDKLFQHLRSKANERRRVVVLTRPGVLPERRELKGIRLLELCDFDAHHIGAWLAAWSRLGAREAPITSQAIADRGLATLAQTPILLLMIAHTWDEYGGDAPPSQAWLYETFFRQIARGKHDRDDDRHKPVDDAAKALYDRLRGDQIDASAEPVDALLWLLSRLAWKDRQKAWEQRLAHRLKTGTQHEPAPEPKPLTRHDVTDVLLKELQLDSDVAQAVELGVVLSLQTDLTTDRDHIHFGHKSFREFLVARYWADRLRRLTEQRLRQRDRSRLVESLLDGRLLLPEDNSFDLLMDILAGDDTRAGSPFGWSRERRETLRGWAEECFNNEAMSFPDEERRAVFDDRRPVLREAALAIGSRICVLDDLDGVEADRPAVMRSMLAWFWATREPVRLIAPRARLGAIQAGATLRGADFRGADLRGASFEHGTLYSATFEGANLMGTKLMLANLGRANLMRAGLMGADLMGADLMSANLMQANLMRANLMRANLMRANLMHADLMHADLMGADLMDANFIGARFMHANLMGANFMHADFSGATIDEVTDLSGAVLYGAHFDEETLARYPDLRERTETRPT